MLDSGPPGVRVEVVEVDVVGAELVGDARDLPHQRRVLQEAPQPEHLAAAEVGTDLHGQPRIPLQPLLPRHEREAYVASVRRRWAERPRRRLAAVRAAPAAAWA